ncbi:hypothetical protein Anapl_03474 [Anas platyrhynchos]|uniref:Uncharacterized protein n=1 Tax=Anas platyrhynchos TaxID=8839 RepID=R0LF42_ANAPL|nr:hypothetical protein Anapl_03474 [Anas platyrhynchos]
MALDLNFWQRSQKRNFDSRLNEGKEITSELASQEKLAQELINLIVSESSAKGTKFSKLSAKKPFQRDSLALKRNQQRPLHDTHMIFQPGPTTPRFSMQEVNIHDLQKICIAFHLSSYLYTGKYEIHKQTKGCESSYNEYADKLLLRTSLSKTLGTENSPQIYAS